MGGWGNGQRGLGALAASASPAGVHAPGPRLLCAPPHPARTFHDSSLLLRVRQPTVCWLAKAVSPTRARGRPVVRCTARRSRWPTTSACSASLVLMLSEGVKRVGCHGGGAGRGQRRVGGRQGGGAQRPAPAAAGAAQQPLVLPVQQIMHGWAHLGPRRFGRAARVQAAGAGRGRQGEGGRVGGGGGRRMQTLRLGTLRLVMGWRAATNSAVSRTTGTNTAPTQGGLRATLARWPCCAGKLT